MKTILALAVTLALVLTSRCFAQEQPQPLPNPIMNPGATWGFQGFAVNSPAAKGWVSYFKSPGSAALALENPEDQLGINILSDKFSQAVSAPEDLVKLLEGSRPTLIDLQKYTVLERQERPETAKGYWCSRYSLKARGEASSDSAQKVLLMAGLTCVDPAQPDLLVDVSYSEVSSRTEMDATFRTLGEQVVGSLRFTRSPRSAEIAQARQAYRDRKQDEAVAILTPLAEAGDREAALVLGDFLMNPSKGPADLPAARKWLRLAAEDGSVQALYNLGVIYDKGPERDLKEAAKWFSLAADQRDPTAQLNLGILYHPKSPAGLEKDVETARRYLLYAANNGNQRAQRLLMRDQAEANRPLQ